MELLIVIGVCWLMLKAVGLALKVTWGAAKMLASLLLAITVPVLILCLMFAGGLVLLIPAAMAALAFGLLKLCF